MKIVIHSDYLVKVDKFPNRVFTKHWDDVKKTDYIIIEGVKYYMVYPRGLYQEEDINE